MDRAREHLGTSDRGVIMIRKTLLEAIKAVEEGHDPPGVTRDPANDPMLKLPDANVILKGAEAKAVLQELVGA